MKKANKSTNKGFKEDNSSENPFLLQSTTFFLTYKGISDTNQELTKKDLANYLLNQNPNDRTLKPEKYLICKQTYESGEPHFHVILVYPHRKQVLRPDFFDYLNIHPNIQTMRNMKAALEYMYKQDPEPYTNMDILQQRRAALAKDGSSLYQFLRQQMLKDPFKFDVYRYCADNNIDKEIYKTYYTKATHLISKMQPAFCKIIMERLPGIKLITPDLIQQTLSIQESLQYYSHPCYANIIAHINEIHRYPNRGPQTMAPSKTPHLLLVGDASIGKSALIDHRPTTEYPYPGLTHYYPCYHLSIGQKFFPPYRSFDYRLVRWNEFTIISDMFPKSGYNRLLDYLEGAPSALPQKGRAPVQRQDNPKHILTSNRTLQQHICKTFNSEQSRKLSRRNIGTRIDCVVVPSGKSIHFLRKLFISN